IEVVEEVLQGLQGAASGIGVDLVRGPLGAVGAVAGSDDVAPGETQPDHPGAADAVDDLGVEVLATQGAERDVLARLSRDVLGDVGQRPSRRCGGGLAASVTDTGHGDTESVTRSGDAALGGCAHEGQRGGGFLDEGVGLTDLPGAAVLVAFPTARQSLQPG